MEQITVCYLLFNNKGKTTDFKKEKGNLSKLKNNETYILFCL
jgi:hypothetical protein